MYKFWSVERVNGKVTVLVMFFSHSLLCYTVIILILLQKIHDILGREQNRDFSNKEGATPL